MLIRRFLLVSALLGSQAFAHVPGKRIRISGSEISLQSTNHAFSGFIKNRLVLGFKLEVRYQSEISLVEGDEKLTSSFGMIGEVFGGDFMVKEEGVVRSFPIHFLGEDWKRGELFVKFAEKEYLVRVQSDDFRNHHFINPTYSLNYDGKEIASFTLHEGEACLGYSRHLVAMIFGAYLF